MTEKNGNDWEQRKVSRYTTRLDKSVGNSKKTIFLKSEGVAHPEAVGYGDIVAEYNSYLRLRHYLRMPKVRILDKGKRGKYLVVQNVPGSPLNEVLRQGRMEEFQNAFRGFTSDLVAMWRSTLQPMDENQLVPGRNVHERCLKRMVALRQNSAIREILNKEIAINGKHYPSLAKLLENSEDFLLNHKEPIMSYAHGDEILQNIISTPSEVSKYMTIDPRSAGDGYYTPAQSANYLIGYTFLYDYDWSSSEMQIHDDHIEITYEISKQFKEKERVLRGLIVEFIEKLDTFGPLEKNMLREYLFSNLMRSYIDEIMPDNLTKTVPHKIAHMALAVELVTNLDACLREPSYVPMREGS